MRSFAAALYHAIGGASQVEIVSHVRHRVSDIKPNFILADSACRKFLASDGYHFVRRAV